MKKYEYMVVYSVRGGVGRIKITSEKLIQSYEFIKIKWLKSEGVK